MNKQGRNGNGRKKAQRGGKRGSGFSQGETESLLELLLEHLPLCKDEWEKISRLHELRYPQQDGNPDSLRRKFSALCRTVPPTGDPSILWDVLKAKEIRKEMTEGADLGDGEDSDDPYTNKFGDTLPFSASHSGSLSAPSGAPTPDPSPAFLEDDFASNDQSRRDSGMELVSPRPLVRKRGAVRKSVTDEDSLMSTVRAGMVQDQINRDAGYQQRLIDRREERERREEKRRIREQERAEERERRADERERSERMTNMFMIAFLGMGASDLISQNTKTKDI